MSIMVYLQSFLIIIWLFSPKGKWTSIGEVQLLTNAGSNSGSLTTISQTASNSKENSFAVGVEENLEVGFGGGGLGNKAKSVRLQIIC